MVAHNCNPSPQEVEAGRLLQVQTSLGYLVRPCLKKDKDKSENKAKAWMSIFYLDGIKTIKNKHRKRSYLSLIIREMHIKTTMS